MTVPSEVDHSPPPPVHWTSSVVHCEKPSNNASNKPPNKQPSKYTQAKTCKVINAFFLQYY